MAFHEPNRPAGISVIRVAHHVSGSSGPPRWAKVGHGRPFYWSPSWLSTRRRIACTQDRNRLLLHTEVLCASFCPLLLLPYPLVAFYYAAISPTRGM
jgi:hypothetical protein